MTVSEYIEKFYNDWVHFPFVVYFVITVILLGWIIIGIKNSPKKKKKENSSELDNTDSDVQTLLNSSVTDTIAVSPSGTLLTAPNIFEVQISTSLEAGTSEEKMMFFHKEVRNNLLTLKTNVFTEPDVYLFKPSDYIYSNISAIYLSKTDQLFVFKPIIFKLENRNLMLYYNNKFSIVTQYQYNELLYNLNTNFITYSDEEYEKRFIIDDKIDLFFKHVINPESNDVSKNIIYFNDLVHSYYLMIDDLCFILNLIYNYKTPNFFREITEDVIIVNNKVLAEMTTIFKNILDIATSSRSSYNSMLLTITTMADEVVKCQREQTETVLEQKLTELKSY
jgi:hypothetical protein